MAREETIQYLRASAPAVLPSMLLCDFGRLTDEVAALEAAGVRALHLDVMDGHFVDNLTYGLTLVEAFRRLTRLTLDVHLMISNPAGYLRRYAEAGADSLTIHIEAVPEPNHVLEQIRELDVAAGLAINPSTPLEAIDLGGDPAEGTPGLADLLLVMSVEPGFGGQSFQPVALDKLRELRRRLGGDVLLEVDGGVNAGTITDCAAAGADLFVVGSGIFRGDDYTASVGQLRDAARQGLASRGR